MCNCEDAPCCGCDQNDLMTPEQIQDRQDAEYLDSDMDEDNWDDEDVLDQQDSFDDDENWDNEPTEMTDVEADADTLRSCGWGNNEDYGDGGGFFDDN